MRDEWQQVVDVAVPAGGAGLLVGTARGVVDKKYDGFGGWIKALVSAVTMAILVGLLIDSASLPKTLALGIVGVAAMVADDLRLGLFQLSGLLSQDPLGFISRVRDAIKGGPRQ